MHMQMTPHYWQLFASHAAGRPAVTTSLNTDLAMIQEWCVILNPKKTKALVVSRSRTVNPLDSDLLLSGVFISASRMLDILGVKFDSRLTFEDHVRYCLSKN